MLYSTTRCLMGFRTSALSAAGKIKNHKFFLEKPMVRIDTTKCVACGGCIDLCPKTAIKMTDDKVTVIAEKCVECKICVQVCPVSAPEFTENAA
ncbi:MAG: 4Fe-4S binding protein, partial [Pseudomonadota bacterium]